VLFVGLEAIGVVEAKRHRVDVSAAIEQAKRYSRDFTIRGDEKLCGAWGDDQAPFMFATNGRPYLKQPETKSETWFLDGRVATNLSHPLMGWYSPSGLKSLLSCDVARSEAALSTESFDYLGLRSYQEKAILAVENAVSRYQRGILLAMATGTGKIRTALGLIYCFLKSERFRRIFFLVDRTFLGVQALGAFTNVKLECPHLRIALPSRCEFIRIVLIFTTLQSNRRTILMRNSH
jgi:type I restriction enzyme R subunit